MLNKCEVYQYSANSPRKLKCLCAASVRSSDLSLQQRPSSFPSLPVRTWNCAQCTQPASRPERQDYTSVSSLCRAEETDVNPLPARSKEHMRSKLPSRPSESSLESVPSAFRAEGRRQPNDVGSSVSLDGAGSDSPCVVSDGFGSCNAAVLSLSAAVGTSISKRSASTDCAFARRPKDGMGGTLCE